MHRVRTLVGVAAVVLLSGCRAGGARLRVDELTNHDRTSGETVFDRRVHLEPEIVRDIPRVPRWCTVLDLRPRYAHVGDAELYYEVEGRGVPLVLLHGGPGATHHYFHPTFSRAARFAQVVYYDQRGCGLSTYNPGAGYTVEQAVDDLDRLRDELGCERWVVLGHSWGGLVAQRYALTYPERVAGLVLVCAELGFEAPLGPGREYEFISEQEQERIRAIQAREDLTLPQLVYNAMRNGDWKRQDHYKPSPEKFARMALYEWCHDTRFRQHVRERERLGTDGAFAGCPIPTLLIESAWDLTWNSAKPEVLHANHPGAQLVLFNASGHSPFDDEPTRFFGVLRAFLSHLPEPDPVAVAQWRTRLAARRERLLASPDHLLRNCTFGWAESREIAQAYSPAWLEKVDAGWPLLRVGFALYDMERYEEALAPLRKLSDVSAAQPLLRAIALVWQGHMLDLLGRRDDALRVYERVVEMGLEDAMQHDQYGLVIAPTPYARERLKTPFQRVENRSEREAPD